MAIDDRQDVNAILGKGSEFEGRLTFEGAVRIDGRFKGEIFTDDTLIIGETAQVAAQIDAGSVVVFGAVNGNIRTRDVLELRSPARLRGNVESPNLVIERGVKFEGSCKMDDSEEPAHADAAISPPAPPEPPRGTPVGKVLPQTTEPALSPPDSGSSEPPPVN